VTFTCGSERKAVTYHLPFCFTNAAVYREYFPSNSLSVHRGIQPCNCRRVHDGDIGSYAREMSPATSMLYAPRLATRNWITTAALPEQWTQQHMQLASRWIRSGNCAAGLSGLTIFLLLADLRSGLGDAAFYEISLNLELLLRAYVHHGVEGQVAR